MHVAAKDEKPALEPSPNGDAAAEPKDPATTPKARKATKAAARHSSDPEQLAADIERTREELAETLDAIAEKVSPKRVAKRTTKKVATAVKETAHDAATSVKDTAASAKDKVTGGAAKSGSDGAPDHVPSEVTTLPTSPQVADTDSSPSGSAFKKEYVAAGAFAVLLAWLLLRRRRRS
jgi:MYXO-CTERM domain-containing protein